MVKLGKACDRNFWLAWVMEHNIPSGFGVKKGSPDSFLGRWKGMGRDREIAQPI